MALIEIDGLPFLTAWWIFPWQTVSHNQRVDMSEEIAGSTTNGWPQSCLVTSSRAHFFESHRKTDSASATVRMTLEALRCHQTWFVARKSPTNEGVHEKITPTKWSRFGRIAGQQFSWSKIFSYTDSDDFFWPQVVIQSPRTWTKIQIDQQGFKKIEIYLPHMGDFTKLMFWPKVWKTERQAMAFRQDDLPRSPYLVRCVTARSSILDVQRFL